MKKIIYSSCLIIFSQLLFAQNATKIKLQVLDQSHNAVRHERFYAFATVDGNNVNMSKLGDALKKNKCFVDLVPRTSGELTNVYRIFVTLNDNCTLKNNAELMKLFAQNGFEIVNIPDELK